jgi:pSer/pThr/pTyr-binding forkhead associated (FHA) protein
MVVGRLPYDSKTPITIIEDHIYTPPPPPRSLKPELSPEVESAILKALEKKRCDRFDKVASLVQVFQAAWTYDANQRTLTSGRPETVRRAVLSGPEGVSFPLAAEKVVLGRNSATGAVHNDIDLSSLDVRKIVSRRHAMVERRGDEYTISDLGSRNGTFLNGERLPAHQPRPLASGDVIEFGTGGVELTFKR